MKTLVIISFLYGLQACKKDITPVIQDDKDRPAIIGASRWILYGEPGTSKDFFVYGHIEMCICETATGPVISSAIGVVDSTIILGIK